MDVSHFELLFKPQSPEDVDGAGPVATVLQGYFLSITNLESEAYQFLLEFVAPEPVPANPNRSLQGKTFVIVDQPSGDNAFDVLDGGAGRYEPSNGLITIQPNETALVAVLPSVFSAMAPITAPDYEVRGYVRLTVPPRRRRRTLDLPILGEVEIDEIVFQSSSPVKVLVTPQNRATYFNADQTISDQTQATLPVCSGSACMEISPFGNRARPFSLSQPRSAGRREVDRIVRRDESRSIAPELFELLSMVQAEESELDAFNAALEQAEIQFKLERRKPRKPPNAKPAAKPR